MFFAGVILAAAEYRVLTENHKAKQRQLQIGCKMSNEIMIACIAELN